MKLAQMIWKLGVVKASSPSILLVHGNKFCKEIWLPVVEHLSQLCNVAGQSAEVIAVDLPGCGDSRPVDFNLPANWWKECLSGLHKTIAEHSGNERQLFGVGHSFGGTTLMACEADKPGTFAQLLAFEPIIYSADIVKPVAGSSRRDDPRFNEESPLCRALRGQMTVFESRQEAFQYFRRFKRFSLIPDDVLQGFIQHGLEKIPGECGRVQLKQDPAFEVDRLYSLRYVAEDFAAMRAPCVFAFGSMSNWGELMAGRDTSEWAKGLAKRFSQAPGAPWEIPGATHMVTLELVEKVAGCIQRLVWNVPAAV